MNGADRLVIKQYYSIVYQPLTLNYSFQQCKRLRKNKSYKSLSELFYPVLNLNLKTNHVIIWLSRK